MAFVWCGVGIGALAIVGFAAGGCGSSRALPAVGEQGGRGGSAGAAASAGASGAGNDAAAGAPGSAGSSGDAGASGWPLIVRLANAGTTDVFLPENLFITCGFLISAAPAAGGDPHLLSVTALDSWCDCNRCARAGRWICDSTDPICDGPPTKLAAGAHLDIGWDGQIAITGSAPPPGSTCPLPCDHWETVTAGEYVFTIDTLGRSFTAHATVPGSAGVITLAINSRP